MLSSLQAITCVLSHVRSWNSRLFLWTVTDIFHFASQCMRFTCYWNRIFFLCSVLDILHCTSQDTCFSGQSPLRAVQTKVFLWEALHLSLPSTLGDCPLHPFLFLWYRTLRFQSPRTTSGKMGKTPWWVGDLGWPCSRSRKIHVPLGSRRWDIPSRNGHTPPGGHLQDRDRLIRN
jgi:hypothetical protein